MENDAIHRALGYPILCWVYGEPGKRCVKCPHCCETCFLPRGAFRDQAFTCNSCAGKFAIYWNAGIRVRA